MIILASELVSKELSLLLNMNVLPIRHFDDLDEPVSTHADMLLFVIDKTVFCYKRFYDTNKELFQQLENIGYSIICIEKRCRKKYPDDVALNVLAIGKKIFCKIDSVAEEIVNYANKHNFEIINVNQGYSACSTLALNERAAITSDVGIKKALEKEGIRVLLVDNENIKLPGYNYGFIGGATGVICNEVIFFGNVKSLKNYEEITSFIKSQNMQYKEISLEGVYDFGGFKCLK